jgi:hypothetical protein
MSTIGPLVRAANPRAESCRLSTSTDVHPYDSARLRRIDGAIRDAYLLSSTEDPETWTRTAATATLIVERTRDEPTTGLIRVDHPGFYGVVFVRAGYWDDTPTTVTVQTIPTALRARATAAASPSHNRTPNPPYPGVSIFVSPIFRCPSVGCRIHLRHLRRSTVPPPR